jgi:hypothetical protein
MPCQVTHAIDRAWLCRGGFIFRAENESWSHKNARQRLLNSGFEVSFLASLLEEGHQTVDFRIIGQRTTEGAARNGRQDLAVARRFFGSIRWRADEDSPTAWSVANTSSVEGTGDHSVETPPHSKLRIHSETE